MQAVLARDVHVLLNARRDVAVTFHRGRLDKDRAVPLQSRLTHGLHSRLVDASPCMDLFVLQDPRAMLEETNNARESRDFMDGHASTIGDLHGDRAGGLSAARVRRTGPAAEKPRARSISKLK